MDPIRIKIVLFGLLTVGLCACAVQQQAGPPPCPVESRRLAEPAPPPAAAETGTPAAIPAPPPPSKTMAVKTARAAKGDAASCYQSKSGTKKTGRCEPQSLPYGRCRSGITSCRLGRENGPLTWFACEQKHGNTGSEPRPGSILVLAAHRGHGMPTGHIMYVEDVIPITPTTYKLILSHTNYDRKCSLEANIEATYDRSTMTMDLITGAWKAWGHGLKLAGFIWG